MQSLPMVSLPKSSGLSLTIATLLSMAPFAAQALDWRFTPRLEMGAVYNDNYLMSTGNVPEREVSGPRGALELGLSATGQLTETIIVPEVRSTYFPDDKDLDSTDTFLRVDWRRRGQRSSLSLDIDYSDQSITESETPSPDATDPTLGSSTIIGANRILLSDNRQQALQGAVGGVFDMTERTRFEFNADYADVSYERNIINNQIDYANFGGSLGVGFEVSQRAVLLLRGLYDKYEPEALGIGSDGYGAELVWRVGATERDRFYVSGGVQRTEFDTRDFSDPETTYMVGAGADRQWQVTTLFVDAMYGVDPSATGSVVKRGQVNVRLRRDFSQALQGRLGALYIQDDPVDDRFASLVSRRYWSGLVGLEWRMSRTFSLVGDYTYTWQEFDATPESGKGNAIVVSLVYQPRRTD
jgi:hypothetical protein